MSFSIHYKFSSMCPYVAINIYNKLLPDAVENQNDYSFNTSNKYLQIIIHECSHLKLIFCRYNSEVS